MNILLLGAGKRVSLINAFNAAAGQDGVELNWYAVESSLDVPISRMGCRPRILLGPAFVDAGFPSYLQGVIQAAQIDVIVPLMDAALVPLAKLRDDLATQGVSAVVSDPTVCETWSDKLRAAGWCDANEIPTPSWGLTSGDAYPQIIKSRWGFGSRNQAVVHNAYQRSAFLDRRRSDQYIVQAFVDGIEYSVDAYVDRKGGVKGIFPRIRVEVEGGEVMVSRSKHHDAIDTLTRKIIETGGFRGPITLQFMDTENGPLLLEINPRFGGGVIHAIHDGLNMPKWILDEHLGRHVQPFWFWTDGTTMSRYRSEVFL